MPLLAVLGVGFLTGFPSAAAAQDQRAILQLVINQVDREEVLVVIREKDILARVSDLEKGNLRGFSGKRESVSGEVYVALSSLAPAVTFEMDEKALLLRLTAQPALLGSTVLDLYRGRPPGIIYGEDTSAFLNYSVNMRDFNRFEALGEAGLSIKGNLLFNSLFRNVEGSVVRGLTNLTLDNRQSLTRWVVGDNFVSLGGLGASLFLAGVSAAREFRLDPYFIRYPTLGLSSAVLTPSTADIYINGLLVRREQLPPGQFELKNLPVATGSGVTRVVIRDAFGREQEILSPFYFTTGVLAPGLHEYSYNLGFRRNNFGTTSWDYGPPAFLGQHRVGFTDTLTAGLRLEGAAGLFSGGPTVTMGLPFGEAEFSGVISQEKGIQGGAAFLGYSYVGRPSNFGAFVRALSPHYATVSLKASDERPWLETNAFVGFQVGPRTSVSLQYTFANSQVKGQSQRIALLTSTRVTERINLFVNGNLSRQPEGRTKGVFVGLTYFFGDTTGSLSYESRGNGGTGTIGLQKSLPLGSGFGYRFQATTTGGDQDRMEGLLQYQGPYGRYEVGHERSKSQDSTNLNVAGGLAVLGGDFFLSPPVQDSFAMIRVPEVAQVRGYLSNQEVGSTNSKGNLLVPNLLSYYGNRLGIADQDIPMDHSVDGTEKIVAPPFRGGVVVAFTVQRIQSLTGTLLLEISGRNLTPGFGQLTVTAGTKQFESPVGKQGEFYLENVPPGSHPAVLEYHETTCRFLIDVPVSDQAVVKMKPLRCVIP